MRNAIPLLATVFGAAALAAASVASAQTLPYQSTDPKMKAAVDDLYAANRILAFEGVITGAGHVSVRSPTNPAHMLISRSLAPPQVVPADIQELDIATCQNVNAKGPLLYQERYIHCSIYKARPDINAVVHSHTPNIIVFSVIKTPLRAMMNGGRILGNGAPVHDMAEVKTKTANLVASMEAGDSLAARMGKGDVVLLRGHGSAVAAADLHSAVNSVMGIETNAELQLKAMATGSPITWSRPSDFTQNEEIAKVLAGEDRGWNAEKFRAGVK